MYNRAKHEQTVLSKRLSPRLKANVVNLKTAGVAEIVSAADLHPIIEI